MHAVEAALEGEKRRASALSTSALTREALTCSSTAGMKCGRMPDASSFFSSVFRSSFVTARSIETILLWAQAKQARDWDERSLRLLLRSAVVTASGRQFDEASLEVAVPDGAAEDQFENALKVPVGADEPGEVRIVVKIVFERVLLVVGIGACDDGRGGDRAPEGVKRDEKRVLAVGAGLGKRMKESDESAVPSALSRSKASASSARSGTASTAASSISCLRRKAQCGKDGGAAAMNVKRKGGAVRREAHRRRSERHRP